MVLGKDTCLTTAQISKLRHVPELVFINCCHLGSMKEDALPRWGKLAANLATEFIEMGCKAVIAAGWAVDDAAAETFAVTFHTAMLDGQPFGEAVLAARSTAYQRHPSSNTWGAYQAYGDERYRLNRETDIAPPAPDYLHVGQVINDLDQLHARIESVNDEKETNEYRQRLEQIEAAARARFFHLAAIRERLGAAWGDFDDKSRAIGHYRAALAQEDGLSSLRALEQLANLEVRHGAALMKKKESRDQGDALMDAGLQRLETLLDIGKTVERLSLLGSSWKRRAQAFHASGKNDRIAGALEEMTKAYLAAVELSLQHGGERDYYPLLNALDGVFLLASRGQRKPLSDMADQRAALLQEAARNGRRRFEVARDYFHAMAEIEAARVNALWACLDNRADEAITREAVQDTLAKSYCDLHARLGNPREKNSALNQIDALVELMADTKESQPVRAALRKLREKIERGG